MSEETLSWHRESCKHPDVICGGRMLYCGGCDCSTPLLDTITTNEPSFAPPPKEPNSRDLSLRWPRSVQYWHFFDDQDAAPAEISESFSIGKAQFSTSDQHPEHLHRVNSHPPLEEPIQIRLLRLSKGGFEDPLHGSFRVTSLQHAPGFQALSYTWSGTESETVRGRVMYLGRRWDAFAITENCQAALRRLRQRDQDVMVWVDAICIDQANVSERNNQVNMMHQIYASASEVFVYLGEMAKGDEEAVERLRWAGQWRSIDSKGREYLRRLFERAYFRRIWVVPEISNAKLAVVHLGSQAFGWSLMNEERLQNLGVQDIVPRWVWTTYNRGTQTTADLLDILVATASAEASDHRDKIFAIFALIRDASENGLISDYALTLNEVYIGISAFLLTHHGSEVLRFAGSSNDQQALPSWVVRWGPEIHKQWHPEETRYREHMMLTGRHILRRGDNIETLVPPRINQTTGALRLRGWKLMSDDTIEESTSSPDYMVMGSGYLLDQEHEPCNTQIRIVTPKAMKYSQKYELVLFENSESIFVVQRSGRPNRHGLLLIGICRVFMPLGPKADQTSLDNGQHDSTSTTRYLMRHCGLGRSEIKCLIEGEKALKTLGFLSDEDLLDLPDLKDESFFADTDIETAFQNYVHANLDHVDGSSWPTASMSSKVAWLQSRLSIWQAADLWAQITSIHQDEYVWGSWRSDKLTFYFDVAHYPRLDATAKIFAEGLVSLVKSLHRTCPALQDRECYIRIGNTEIELFNDTSSVKKAAVVAILELRKHHPDLNWWDYAQFCDWTSLEAILQAIGLLQDKKFETLRLLYQRRRILRALQPQARTLQTFTII